MISETAMKALQVRSGIETCKVVDEAGKWTIIDRIIYDLDEAGNAEGVETVRLVLRDAWERFPDKPEMKGFLGRQVAPALPETGEGGEA